jgi:hypothetical protein
MEVSERLIHVSKISLIWVKNKKKGKWECANGSIDLSLISDVTHFEKRPEHRPSAMSIR